MSSDLRYKKIKSSENMVTKGNYYNRTNTCDRCRTKLIAGVNNPYREHNKEGNWTGKWICRNCNQKYDPNSQHNKIKSVTNCRTKNQNPNSNRAKGDNFEQLTDIWLEPENLNKKNDNYNFPYDHGQIMKHILVNIGDKTIDLYGKIPQTKGRFYNSIEDVWGVGCSNEHGKIFDYLILYCTTEDGKYIERLYFIPKEEIEKRGGITIYKNPSKGGWYEDYRIKDEEIIELVNNIWKEIIGGY